MSDPTPGTAGWLKQVEEDIIDAERPIIDPHHHLWRRADGNDYLVDNLWQDTGSGHNIVKTIFVECHAEYRTEGPDHLKPLGETEFVTEQAAMTVASENKAEIAAIVGHVNLTRGEMAREPLQAHIELAKGKFRGIRHAGARDPHPEALMIAGRAPKGLYQMTEFREGIKVLADMDLTFDTWHYHHQNRDFADLARACPDTRMILDHFGTPLGVGPYEAHREEIFEQWKLDIAEIAQCENVVVKIGGLAMPDNGFGWHARETPATSDEFVAAQKRYYLHTIECFGPDRCMMESNFPVDKLSISYHVLYNGLKKIIADFSEDEKHAMFYGTAARVYRID